MVKIECEILNFEFENHINIIGSNDGLNFDSGVYKSFLFESLRDQQHIGMLESNCNIRFADSPYAYLDSGIHSSDCIIIDETNFAPKQLNELLYEIRKANAYLISIGRMYVKQLEYSVDAIYKVEYTNDTFRLSRAFENVNKCNDECNIIACEDSAAVAAVYSEILSEDVITVNGRSNFYRYVKSHNVSFIIADKPKFGQDLLNLIYKIKSNVDMAEKLVLFLPSCFEEIICEICKLNDSKLKISDYFDLEYYYEAMASNEGDWNKNKVAASVFKLHEKYNFDNSKLLQDLYKFWHKEEVLDKSRCYVVNIDNWLFNQVSSKTKIESIVKTNMCVDRMNVF